MTYLIVCFTEDGVTSVRCNKLSVAHQIEERAIKLMRNPVKVLIFNDPEETKDELQPIPTRLR